MSKIQWPTPVGFIPLPDPSAEVLARFKNPMLCAKPIAPPNGYTDIMFAQRADGSVDVDVTTDGEYWIRWFTVR